MIGECLSSLKVPSFLQNSIQMRKSPQHFILSVITKKRVPKTPILCVFSTLLTSDMFSYFPPKYNNFWLSQSTRNQVVAQAARGFESHPVRQLCGFAYFCEPAFTLCFLPNFALNLSIIRYRTVYSSSLLLRKPYPHNQDENKYLPLLHNRCDRVSFEFVSYLHRFSALCSLPCVCNRKALNFGYCFSW